MLMAKKIKKEGREGSLGWVGIGLILVLDTLSSWHVRGEQRDEGRAVARSEVGGRRAVGERWPARAKADRGGRAWADGARVHFFIFLKLFSPGWWMTWD